MQRFKSFLCKADHLPSVDKVPPPIEGHPRVLRKSAKNIVPTRDHCISRWVGGYHCITFPPETRESHAFAVCFNPSFRPGGSPAFLQGFFCDGIFDARFLGGGPRGGRGSFASKTKEDPPILGRWLFFNPLEGPHKNPLRPNSVFLLRSSGCTPRDSFARADNRF